MFYLHLLCLNEEVKLSAILYLKPEHTQLDVDELIHNIKTLDNNDQLYKEKYESAFFKNGRVPDFLNKEFLQSRFDHSVRSLGYRAPGE